MKINRAQQNQALTFPIDGDFAHPMPVTPTVKSRKTCSSSFNGVGRSARFGKSADPTCYNLNVGNPAALFDIARN